VEQPVGWIPLSQGRRSGTDRKIKCPGFCPITKAGSWFLHYRASFPENRFTLSGRTLGGIEIRPISSRNRMPA
jgi:hypothetical protein